LSPFAADDQCPVATFFTKDTIRENIRLARPDASDADVEEACKQAHVHSVITDPMKPHGGYDTVADVQVPSGGQKRLITLARCLFAQARGVAARWAADSRCRPIAGAMMTFLQAMPARRSLPGQDAGSGIQT
jgi:hypothetical protein